LQYQVSNAQQCSHVSTLAFLSRSPSKFDSAFESTPNDPRQKDLKLFKYDFKLLHPAAHPALYHSRSDVQQWSSYVPNVTAYFFLALLHSFTPHLLLSFLQNELKLLKLDLNLLFKTAQFYCILDVFVPIVEGFSEHGNGHGVSF
jgi:hypothetical protein